MCDVVTVLVGAVYCCCVSSHDTRLLFSVVVSFHVQCIITPALAGSKIVMEAYKKFVLVSLLVDGEVTIYVIQTCMLYT